MQVTTVGELKEFIRKNELADDTPFLVPGHDHSLVSYGLAVENVLMAKDDICEDYGDLNPPEVSSYTRRKALVLR